MNSVVISRHGSDRVPHQKGVYHHIKHWGRYRLRQINIKGKYAPPHGVDINWYREYQVQEVYLSVPVGGQNYQQGGS